MSTSGSSEEQAGEVRRRRARDRAAEAPSAPEPPPLSRREMKARGILLTTEIPVIQEPPGWGGKASAAVSAHRASAERADAGRAVAAVGAAPSPSAGTGTARSGAAAAAPHPSRRAMREDRQHATAVPNKADKAGAQTATGRRPVVRAPLTARGLRTVDESGAITGVHSAIGHAVGRAIESATSPASWESAVSLPAVALGIEDVAGSPTQGYVAAPEQVSERVAELPAEPLVADASRLGVTGGVRAVAADGRAEMEAKQAAARRAIREAARQQAGLHRAEPSRDGGGRALAVKIAGVVAVVAAVVVLVYLVSTGALSSLFAQAPDGLGPQAGTLAVAVGALWMPRALRQAAADPSLEEIRDR